VKSPAHSAEPGRLPVVSSTVLNPRGLLPPGSQPPRRMSLEPSFLPMPADAARQSRLTAPRTLVVCGCALLWACPCHAEDPKPALSPMRSEVIAGFSYTPKPDSVPARTDAVRAPNNHGDPLDPDVVVMDPLVRARRPGAVPPAVSRAGCQRSGSRTSAFRLKILDRESA